MEKETLTNYLQLRMEVRNRAFEVFKKIYHGLYLANGRMPKNYSRLEQVIDEDPDSVKCEITTVGITHQIFALSYRWYWAKSHCGAEDSELLEFEGSTEFMWDNEKLEKFIENETANFTKEINKLKNFLG